MHTQPEEHNGRTEHTAVYRSSWATLKQLRSSKMVVEPLLLNHNEFALSLLEELGRSNVRNAKCYDERTEFILDLRRMLVLETGTLFYDLIVPA